MIDQQRVAQDVSAVFKLFGVSDLKRLLIKDFVIVVGHTVLFDQNVTVGLRIKHVQEGDVLFNFKSAICSKEDIFKKDLGEQITIGRLMTDSASNFRVEGDIDLILSAQIPIGSGMEQLTDAMRIKAQNDKNIEHLEKFYNGKFSNALEDLV